VVDRGGKKQILERTHGGTGSCTGTSRVVSSAGPARQTRAHATLTRSDGRARAGNPLPHSEASEVLEAWLGKPHCHKDGAASNAQAHDESNLSETRPVQGRYGHKRGRCHHQRS